MQLIFESESNSKNQTRTKSDSQTNEKKFDNRADKIRTYVVDEKNELEKNFHEKQNQKQKNYHVDDENLTYYESNNQNDEQTVNFISFVFATTSKSRCRHCKKSFSFNNNLYQHLRVNCSTLIKISMGKTFYVSTSISLLTSISTMTSEIEIMLKLECLFR